MVTTTDYDAPRVTAAAEESLEVLQTRRFAPDPAIIDVDENGMAAAFELPYTHLLDEELTAAVIPMRPDEFRCTRCTQRIISD
jgi:hypothetical protein